jgi:serine/threonine protein kinase
VQGQTFGHYQVISLLGKGGMGEVYRARDTRLDRDVALKILPADSGADPERGKRFEREAKLIAVGSGAGAVPRRSGLSVDSPFPSGVPH